MDRCRCVQPCVGARSTSFPHTAESWGLWVIGRCRQSRAPVRRTAIEAVTASLSTEEDTLFRRSTITFCVQRLGLVRDNAVVLRLAARHSLCLRPVVHRLCGHLPHFCIDAKASPLDATCQRPEVRWTSAARVPGLAFGLALAVRPAGLAEVSGAQGWVLKIVSAKRLETIFRCP
jgi:hypothetical protein